MCGHDEIGALLGGVSDAHNRMGRRYRKARYVGFTSGAFSAPLVDAHNSSTGILGPALRAAPGDALRFTVRGRELFRAPGLLRAARVEGRAVRLEGGAAVGRLDRPITIPMHGDFRSFSIDRSRGAGGGGPEADTEFFLLGDLASPRGVFAAHAVAAAAPPGRQGGESGGRAVSLSGASRDARREGHPKRPRRGD